MINELLRLLNIKSGIELSANHPLTDTFRTIDDCKRKKQFELGVALLQKIQFLVEQLKRIEEYDVNLLRKFTKRLCTVNKDTYQGERLEINIAASLIKKNVDFIKSDPPDFKKVENQDINIECTSIHLDTPVKTEKKLLQKLHKTIKKKSKRHYSKPNTALFIDVTNLYFHSLDLHSKLFKDRNILKTVTKKFLRSSDYGAIVVFTLYYNDDKKRYESSYNRIDNEGINTELYNFLEEYYPIGKIYVEKFIVHPQG